MDPRARGERAYKGLIGRLPTEALAELEKSNPQLYGWLVGGAFAGPLAKGELSGDQRELATLAIIAALGGAERQLATHTAAALRAGLAPSELLALAEHLTVYAGFPRGLNANTVIANTLAEHQVPSPPALEEMALGDHSTLVASHGTTGPPVVLIHALGLDWRMWEPVMASLAEGRRVYAYDIRGHGHAVGAATEFDMETTAMDLFALMDGLGLARAHVIGLSYGGGIAQTAAVRDPERFESLALLATTDYPFEAFEARAF